MAFNVDIQGCGHDERFGGVFGAVEGCIACELEKTARELREEREMNARALDQRSEAMMWLLRQWAASPEDPMLPSQLCALLTLRAGGHVGQQLAIFADAFRKVGE